MSPQDVAKDRFRQGTSHGLVAQANRHRVVAGRGLRCNPLPGLSRKYQERTLGSRMLDRAAHQSVEQLFEHHLARKCLRYVDNGSKVEVFGNRAGRGGRRFLGPRALVALIDYLLMQRTHVEVNASRSDLPFRRIVLVNSATGQLDGSTGRRAAVEWALVLGFKGKFNEYGASRKNHVLHDVAISGE